MDIIRTHVLFVITHKGAITTCRIGVWMNSSKLGMAKVAKVDLKKHWRQLTVQIRQPLGIALPSCPFDTRFGSPPLFNET